MFYHPLKLKGEVLDKMTEEEFLRFCRANEAWRIEKNVLGEVLFRPKSGCTFSKYNTAISYQLISWSRERKKGLAFGNNTGFKLPDESVFSPDAAWISDEKWNTLTKEEKLRFAPICPEFVIELKSPSDEISALKEKMLKWIENGVQLGVLVNPDDKETYRYFADGRIDAVKGFENKVDCGAVLEGFELDLSFMKSS